MFFGVSPPGLLLFAVDARARGKSIEESMAGQFAPASSEGRTRFPELTRTLQGFGVQGVELGDVYKLRPLEPG